jgi:hypothetical protein
MTQAAVVSAGLVIAVLLLIADPASAQPRPGVAPQDAWTCPAPQPIKGNFTPASGERCIYHLPGGKWYGKTKPERCYTTEAEATQDGCRRSKQ